MFQRCYSYIEFATHAGIYPHIQGKQAKFLIKTGMSFCNGRYANFCKLSFITIP